MHSRDTIAAIATPPGQGGIAVIRVSGPVARAIAIAVLGAPPPPRVATRCAFRGDDARAIDHGIALFFPSPRSYTGEDVLELHSHGSPVVLDLLLVRLTALGARLARPGEFSERAFLNGKMDLAQAEAIADLISASSVAAARSALRSLEGEFSRRVHVLTEALIRARVQVEAAIDFPEEELDFLADERLHAQLDAITQQVTELQRAAAQGSLLQAGMTVVLVGPVNAGKSSLLNALAQSDAAIVSDVPGTTRDVLRERINLDGMPVHVVDTAGLRATGDAIETEGMRRARAALMRADRVLAVLDDRYVPEQYAAIAPEISATIPHTVIYNKIDLTRRVPGMVPDAPSPTIALSAVSGAGLETLRAHLKGCMGFQSAGEDTFIARRRHLDAIERAGAHVRCGREQLNERRAGELLAEELRLAQRALGEITGEFVADDLLGRVFSSFCIGK